MVQLETVGLVPAAGLGSRLAPIPFSKELFPVGFVKHPGQEAPHAKVVSAYLLEKYRAAGVQNTFFILRKGKWDIPDYFGDGSQLGMHLGYLIMNLPYGTPFSLDQAYNFIKDKNVVMGFPDILFEPDDAFTQLLQKQEQTNADVVLGAFKVDKPHKWDMVELNEDGYVTAILPKPVQSELTYGWAIACWRPSFSDFMHKHLNDVHHMIIDSKIELELSVGAVIQAAIHNGLKVQSVCFDEGSCLDVGTPEDLQKAIRKLT